MILEAKEITSGYGKIDILHNINIHVEKGKITAIIGPNGAGKSTFLKTVFGYLKPKNGRIIFKGEDVTGLRPDQVLPKGLAYIPQSRALFPQMTVKENLLLGAYTVKDRFKIEDSLKQVFNMFPALAEKIGSDAITLSGGQQRALEIARALMLSPELMMLDEPSATLAPKLIDEVYDTIRGIKAGGTTLLIVEQNVYKVLEVADYIYALELGRNTHEGPPEEFMGKDTLRRIYLGE